VGEDKAWPSGVLQTLVKLLPKDIELTASESLTDLFDKIMSTGK